LPRVASPHDNYTVRHCYLATHRARGRRARAIVGGLITAAILGAGHAIITFIVSLIVAALLIAAISHPRSHAYLNGGRRRRRLHI
jgi:hypothetical protein